MKFLTSASYTVPLYASESGSEVQGLEGRRSGPSATGRAGRVDT